MGLNGSKNECELLYISPGEEQDLDLSTFLYENDPDFRAQCQQLMEESGLGKDEVLRMRRTQTVDEQRIAYNKIESSNNASSHTLTSKESPYDKVLNSIKTREKDAVLQFKTNVLAEQDGNVDNAAKYSNAKGKKKSSAAVYAEMSKENAKELQSELIVAQEKIVNDLWTKQEKFLTKILKKLLRQKKRLL